MFYGFWFRGWEFRGLGFSRVLAAFIGFPLLGRVSFQYIHGLNTCWT